MKKSVVAVLLLLLVIVLQPVAAEFTAMAKHKELALCSCATYANDVSIINQETSSAAYSVSHPKTPSWVSTSPSSITLKANAKGTLRNILAVPCNVKGTYELHNRIASGNEQKELVQIMKVDRCPNTQVTLPTEEASYCACTPSSYTFELANVGSFEETYLLNTSPYSEYATFNENPVTLAAYGKKNITLSLELPCEISGDQTLNLIFFATKNNVGSKLAIPLNARACKDITMSIEGPENMCAGASATAKITVKNLGDKKTNLNLASDISWLEAKENITLDAGQEETFSVKIQPPEHISGIFSIPVSAMSGPAIAASTKMSLEVKQCYTMQWNVPQVTACNGKYTTAEMEFINLGEEKASFTLAKESPDWITTKDKKVTLEPKETKKVTITIAPRDQEPGEYGAMWKLTGQNGFVQEKTMSVSVSSKENCALVNIYPTTDLKLPYEHKQTPLVVENLGYSTQSYIFALEASNWITLHPTHMTLAAGEKGVLYLETNPTEGIESGQYKFSITTHTSGEDLAYTKSMTLTLRKYNLGWIFWLVGGIILLSAVSAYALTRPKKTALSIELIRDQEEKEKTSHWPWIVWLIGLIALLMGAWMVYKKSTFVNTSLVGSYLFYYLVYVVVIVFVLMAIVIAIERRKPSKEVQENVDVAIQQVPEEKLEEMPAPEKKEKLSPSKAESSSDVVKNFDMLEKKDKERVKRQQERHAKKEKPYRQKVEDHKKKNK